MIELIRENPGATAIAVYLFVRVIVAATPTPKDDEALKRVNPLLRYAAAVFGLDLKQGINKKAPIIVLAGVVALSGCATVTGIAKDPAKQYQASSIAYAEAVKTLVVLKKAGELSEKEIATADEAIKLGQKILNDWADALEAGKSYPGVSKVTPIILKINEIANKHKDPKQ